MPKEFVCNWYGYQWLSRKKHEQVLKGSRFGRSPAKNLRGSHAANKDGSCRDQNGHFGYFDGKARRVDAAARKSNDYKEK
jgi:hypothetical protein